VNIRVITGTQDTEAWRARALSRPAGTHDRSSSDTGSQPHPCGSSRQGVPSPVQPVNLADYPNPDLAIEIDISRSKVDRPGIMPGIGIPEVWRFDGDVVVIEEPEPDGQYAAVKRSRWLPVRPEDIRSWLVKEDAFDDVEWKRRLTEWAKGLAAGGNGA
jgi:hypothetical protein